jgi:hypothetical protein
MSRVFGKTTVIRSLIGLCRFVKVVFHGAHCLANFNGRENDTKRKVILQNIAGGLTGTSSATGLDGLCGCSLV